MVEGDALQQKNEVAVRVVAQSTGLLQQSGAMQLQALSAGRNQHQTYLGGRVNLLIKHVYNNVISSNNRNETKHNDVLKAAEIVQHFKLLNLPSEGLK